MRTMSIRVFLRGGYLTMTEGTVVMRHSVPLFTAVPHNPPMDGAEVLEKGAKTVADIVKTVRKSKG